MFSTRTTTTPRVGQQLTPREQEEALRAVRQLQCLVVAADRAVLALPVKAARGKAECGLRVFAPVFCQRATVRCGGGDICSAWDVLLHALVVDQGVVGLRCRLIRQHHLRPRQICVQLFDNDVAQFALRHFDAASPLRSATKRRSGVDHAVIQIAAHGVGRAVLRIVDLPADAQHMAVCVNLPAVCRIGALCSRFPVVLRHRQHAALEVDALRCPWYPLSAVLGVVGRGRGAYLRQGVQDAARQAGLPEASVHSPVTS